VPRITETPNEQQFDADDLAAVALLRGPLNRAATNGILMDAAPLVGMAGTRGPARVYPNGLALSPLCDIGVNLLGLGCIKSEAHGRISSRAHWWGTLTTAFDAGGPPWSLHPAAVPCAVEAGIALEAIEALRDDRVDRLGEDDRQYVAFVRAVQAGTMTDGLWQRQVALVGSERGTVESAVLYLHIQMGIRLSRVFGHEPSTDAAALQAALDEARAGSIKRPDLEAYRARFRAHPWPRDMLHTAMSSTDDRAIQED
jgi:hypothetical protein